jgi:hypothetical protein
VTVGEGIVSSRVRTASCIIPYKRPAGQNIPCPRSIVIE